MSTTATECDTVMKLADIKVEKSESENVAETPLDALELDLKNEPLDENKAIEFDMQNDSFQERFEENIETSVEAQQSCCFDYVSTAVLIKHEPNTDLMEDDDGARRAVMKPDCNDQVEMKIDVMDGNDCKVGQSSSSKSKSVKSPAAESQNKCEICGETFIRADVFKKHLVIHTREKPYECPICGKSFAQLSGLKKHQLIHTGEKNHQCHVCDKAFAESGNLKQHLRIHSGQKPHQCFICSKTFTRANHLKVHLLRHNGEKPYQCPICSKSFTQLRYLTWHQLIHTGEKIINVRFVIKHLQKVGN